MVPRIPETPIMSASMLLPCKPKPGHLWPGRDPTLKGRALFTIHYWFAILARNSYAYGDDPPTDVFHVHLYERPGPGRLIFFLLSVPSSKTQIRIGNRHGSKTT